MDGQPLEASQPTVSQDDIYSAFHAYSFTTDSEWQSGLASILGHPETPATQAELDTNPGLILNAKLFYFSRKHNLPPIDAAGYVEWLRSWTQQHTLQAQSGEANPSNATSEPTHIAAQPLAAPDALSPSAAPAPAAPVSSQEPPYPTSFAAIVDLITSNKPIPGIEEIPNTVLDPGSSKIDHTPRRKKPWEKDAATDPPLQPGQPPQPATGISSDAVEVVTEGNAGTSETQQSSMATTSNSHSSVNGYITTGEGIVKILQPNAIPPSGLLATN